MLIFSHYNHNGQTCNATICEDLSCFREVNAVQCRRSLTDTLLHDKRWKFDHS